MKYILMMSGTKPGVGSYMAWTQQDRDNHMAALKRIQKELTESGEFVTTQPLAPPQDAIMVRGEKNGMPVTDGVFPESKEFLLGFWIVDVATPERAYAVAAMISSAPGPGRVPTNMPMEVRAFVTYPGQKA